MMMMKEALSSICGCITDAGKDAELKAKVILMKKNVLDLNDFRATILDGLQDFLGQVVSFQLVSSTVGDWNNENRGIVGEPAYLDHSILTLPTLIAGETEFGLTFKYHETEGIPGAVVVKNHHLDEFFLKSITIENFPGKGRIHFVCNSWVYNVNKYTYDRIFFSNDVYLPKNTPGPLRPYREEELVHLRGNDVNRELQEWDRVYNYAYYNDLGNPDEGIIRPILGGSTEHPYPRRGRTGRPPTRTDPKTESRLSLLGLDIYVPRDERFGHLKMADFLGYSLKSLALSFVPKLRSKFDHTPAEFDTFDDVMRLFEGGLPIPQVPLLEFLHENDPFTFIKAIFSTTDGQQFMKFPLPDIVKDDRYAWRTDEEFAREMLAGVNPVIIQRLQEFPPTSTLDPSKYGNQISSIAAADILKNLEGQSVEEALSNNRLYILDHHDGLMPYMNRINSTTNKIYATRTLLLLKDDSTLKPLAIELSLPNPDGEHLGAVSKVLTPSEQGVEGIMWQLAKAYVAVNDYGIHQLVSHWLRTHAVTEPFVIATNRRLSALHPINKLLVPHFRDTMNINAYARQGLINGGGILESIVFPNKYAMEMSSFIYKSWNFTEQALPVDLLKRGVAVEDPTGPQNLRLLIPDYPYAVDGIEIWSAIETWVADYISIYYPNDSAVQSDVELQSWWTEIVQVGHGDHKDEPWWPRMQTVGDLKKSCTIIIWVASALHAAVNFGQYAYTAYVPNRPTISRTADYDNLLAKPEKAFLDTITNELDSIVGISLMEILSMHASDEIYLGQRASPEWTKDEKALGAFRRFAEKLRGVERRIDERNKDRGLKNRTGPVNVPYTLLFPTSTEGVTGRGIPNSVSI
ncbi:probable linoleate 9S-lipoxygenase 5 [Asparagus officinalis]|uniref:probable linoleate 9S-lipoxygenase 5 n=1 Tax=Asparagus officinalis TaxID=4686 RepID=UPI00098E0DCF|nr:probable linoleate 9S-lipoxygenase 5 [Asparagus officinalis]